MAEPIEGLGCVLLGHLGGFELCVHEKNLALFKKIV